jgi:hypothetical protein
VIEIDLNARVLTEGHSAFVVRPGNGYGLFAEITQRSLLILELPGLGLMSGQRPDDDDLRRRVNRSRALRGWYRGDKDAGSKPAVDVQTYDTGGGNSTGQFAGLVRTFFEKMKVGDLVIVPPKSYMEDAWIGEICGAEYEVESVTVGRLFGEEPLPARSVRWLSRIPKRDLPYSILEALEKPNAAFLVDDLIAPFFIRLHMAIIQSMTTTLLCSR